MVWGCVMTKPGEEKRAAVNLWAQEFETFLPMALTVVRDPISHRRRLASAPLFPRYLFVGIGAAREWGPINDTRGVTRVLTRPDLTLLPVPPAVIAELQARDMAGIVLPAARRPGWTVGQRVRVLAGPATGFEAMILGPADSRNNWLLDILGAPGVVTAPEAILGAA